MEEIKARKTFIECLSDFISDPEGFTQEELLVELQKDGTDIAQLEKRVTEIVRKGSTERRLVWQGKARERREEIVKILESKQPAKATQDLISKIMEILKGNYGQGALSYAETYFRKKESLSEKDIKGLIEDLENLNLIEEQSKKED